jgi:hypothetical protein
MRSAARPFVLAALIVGTLPSFAVAQQRRAVQDDAEWLENCRRDWGGRDDDHHQACEVRQVPVRLSGRSLQIDGRANGSIHARGWDGDSVRVTARLQAWGGSTAEAESMLKQIRVTAEGRAVRAEGPSGMGGHRADWSASYVVSVPRHFDLSLDANNGSLGVTGVEGRLDLETTNGSVWLASVAGDVRARTQNGSMNVELAGTSWQGSGLDAETHNGSVRMLIPDRYAAQLETGTVNGRIETDFPVTVQGRITRQLSIPLNGGGKTIRVHTQNGSVRLVASH